MVGPSAALVTLVSVLGAGAACAVSAVGTGDGPAAGRSAKAVPARGAVTLHARGGERLRGRWQGWADAALMPTVPGRVKVVLTGCPR